MSNQEFKFMLKKLIKSVLNYCRMLVLFFRNNTFGKNNVVCKGALLLNCDIGNWCYLGMYSYFNHVKMGNYCSIAGNVTIGAMEHDYTDISTSTFISEGGYDNRTTVLGNGVWIGAQCVIRQGVNIGNGAVIGANSFVNSDIPPYSIAFGTPARIYKFRFDKMQINKIENSKFWEFHPEDAKKIIELLK